MAHLHSLPTPVKLSKLGRGLAAAQVIKETLTIVLLGVPLVREEPIILLSALPGLVLYLLHWQMWRGRVRRRYAAAVWAFTLLDELWGWFLFRELDAPTRGQVRLMHWSYFLGLGLILLALVEVSWRYRRARAKTLRKPAEPAQRPG